MDGTPTRPENKPQNERSDMQWANTPPRTLAPRGGLPVPAWEEDEIPGTYCMLTEDQTAHDKARMIIECFGPADALATLEALLDLLEGEGNDGRE